MKKALISIGIGRTGGSLPPLKGAVQDARDIHAWGQQQGFDCTMFVDDVNKVRVADAFEAIKEYLDAGTYSQIVIYFSGHGILQAPGCELWLMSGAPDNPNEVVNVPASMNYARSCGLEHVVFISDACRTLPTDGFQAALGPGGNLFPVMRIQSPLPELDVYFATLPGDPAHEIAGDEAVKRKRGLFTGCLLDALNGEVHEVLNDLDISGVLSRVVHGRPLKTWLATAVPLAAEHASIVLRQRPEIRIESDNSKYLARFSSDHQPVASAGVPVQNDQSEVLSNGTDRAKRRLVPSRASSAGSWDAPNPSRTAIANLQPSRDAKFREQLTQSLAIASSLDADVAVFGGAVNTGFWRHGKLEGFGGGDAFLMHLREADPSKVPTHPMQRTLALTLEDGSCVPLYAPQGYVTTVHLDGTRVGSINCVAKGRSTRGGDSPMVSKEIDEFRIEAALLARSGQLVADSSPVRAFAERPLLFQDFDPSLGVLVSYAYARAGRLGGWDAIVRQFREAKLPMPFDLELMSAVPTDATYPQAAPGMPMLTEGWLLLGPREESMPDSLKIARQHLLPSLWATFSRTGGDYIHRYLTEA